MVGPIESTITDEVAEGERRIVVYLGWTLATLAAVCVGIAFARTSERIVFIAAAIVSGLLAASVLLAARRRVAESRTP